MCRIAEGWVIHSVLHPDGVASQDAKEEDASQHIRKWLEDTITMDWVDACLFH